MAVFKCASKSQYSGTPSWQKRGPSKEVSLLQLEELLGTGNMPHSLRIASCVLLKALLRELLSICYFVGFGLNDSYAYVPGNVAMLHIYSPSLRIACKIPPAQTFARTVGAGLVTGHHRGVVNSFGDSAAADTSGMSFDSFICGALSNQTDSG